ncbi:MAG: hypothetical protein QOH24_662 [Verrucomicrobiota bacterium]
MSQNNWRRVNFNEEKARLRSSIVLHERAV